MQKRQDWDSIGAALVDSGLAQAGYKIVLLKFEREIAVLRLAHPWPSPTAAPSLSAMAAHNLSTWETNGRRNRMKYQPKPILGPNAVFFQASLLTLLRP